MKIKIEDASEKSFKPFSLIITFENPDEANDFRRNLEEINLDIEEGMLDIIPPNIFHTLENRIKEILGKQGFLEVDKKIKERRKKE